MNGPKTAEGATKKPDKHMPAWPLASGLAAHGFLLADRPISGKTAGPVSKSSLLVEEGLNVLPGKSTGRDTRQETTGLCGSLPEWMRYRDNKNLQDKRVRKQRMWVKQLIQVVSGFGILITFYFVLSLTGGVAGGQRALSVASGDWIDGKGPALQQESYAGADLLGRVVFWLESMPQIYGHPACSVPIRCAVENPSGLLWGAVAPAQVDVMEARLVSRNMDISRIAVRGLIILENRDTQAFECTLTVRSTDSGLLIQHVD